MAYTNGRIFGWYHYDTQCYQYLSVALGLTISLMPLCSSVTTLSTSRWYNYEVNMSSLWGQDDATMTSSHYARWPQMRSLWLQDAISMTSRWRQDCVTMASRWPGVTTQRGPKMRSLWRQDEITMTSRWRQDDIKMTWRHYATWSHDVITVTSRWGLTMRSRWPHYDLSV